MIGSRERTSRDGSRWWRQRPLPKLARVYILVPLTLALIFLGGNFLTLPPGPLCDEGMVLFMEGGCDWGLSNVFFFSKAGLLAGLQLAAIACLLRRSTAWQAFSPHLAILLGVSWLNRDGGMCDSYYAEPNGNLGQMGLEGLAFACLGIALVVRLADSARWIQGLGVVAWNAAYVGVFYLWLAVAPHWTWSHTALVAGSLLVAAWLTTVGGGQGSGTGSQGDSHQVAA